MKHNVTLTSASGLWRLQWGQSRQSNNANMERPTPA